MTYQPEEYLYNQELPTCLKCGYEELDLANFYDEERKWICPKCGLNMNIIPKKTVLFDIEKVSMDG